MEDAVPRGFELGRAVCATYVTDAPSSPGRGSPSNPCITAPLWTRAFPHASSAATLVLRSA